MAATRLSSVRSLCYSVKIGKLTDARPMVCSLNRNYHTVESGYVANYPSNGIGVLGLNSAAGNRFNSGWFASKLDFKMLPMSTRLGVPFGGICSVSNYRSYASSVSSQNGNNQGPEVTVAPVNDGGSGGSDWIDKIKEVWNSTLDGLTSSGEKDKEASSEVTSYVQQLLDAHPYLKDVVLPVGGTLMGTLLAWVVLPKMLRKFHKYSVSGPATLLLWGPVPYEKSIWGALEDPVRYLITFMAFSQIGAMVAPTTIASQYIGPAWRGAVIISFVWFLHRWKTNVFSRALVSKSLDGSDRNKLLALDRISSVGLFVLGSMALAEACGVAVQSILTVGGIGGVAAAFASKDVLGNILSGLSVQITQPFSIGDTIKAGSVEGQVVEMGLTTTSLLTAEKFPVIVPNSLFSSQVIVNKSRAQWQAIVTKIPLQIGGDFDKITKISDDIKAMLRSNPNVFLEKEAPYCFLSQVERSFAELTLGYNLKSVSKDQYFTAQQDILLQSVQIIKQHDASLGSSLESSYN